MKKRNLFVSLCLTLGLSMQLASAAPGIVAHWTFEEPGDNAADWSDNGHNGIFHGVTKVSTLWGKAASFSGNENSWVEIKDHPDFKIDSALSIETFLTVKALPAQHGLIFFRGDNSYAADPYYLSVQPNQTVRFHIETQGLAWDEIEAPIALNEPLHIVATFSQAQKLMKLFINGIMVVSKETSIKPFLELPDPSSGAVSIGNHVFPGEHYFPFTGTIEDLTFYNYALSADTIKNHFSILNVQKTEEPQRLVAYWSFDSLAGNTLFDMTGHGFNAHISGDGLDLTKGVSGWSLSCSGNDFDITIPKSRDSFNLKKFSIECWYKPNRIPHGVQQKLFDFETVASGMGLGYTLCLLDNGYVDMAAWGADKDYWVDASSKTTLSAGTWSHLVGIFDGTYLKVYVNGHLEGSTLCSGGPLYPVQNDARIGAVKTADQRGIIYRADGLIDEMKLYNYPLLPDTIMAHYRALSPNQLTDTAQAFASWSFDSVSGKTFFDVTGHNFNAVGTGDSLHIVPNGVKGKALELRGDGSNLNMLDIAVQNSVPAFNLRKFSIESWIYSYVDLNNQGSPYNQKGIFEFVTCGMELSGITGGYALAINDDGRLRFSWSAPTQGSWQYITGEKILQAQQWYHVAATFDSTAAKLYVNGSLVAQMATPQSYYAASYSARIGCQFQLTTPPSGRTRIYFNGLLDELKLYDYVIDNQAVRLHYESLKPGFPLSIAKQVLPMSSALPEINCINKELVIHGACESFAHVRICSLNGKILENRVFPSAEGTALKLSLSSYKPGTYVYRIALGNEEKTGMFVVGN